MNDDRLGRQTVYGLSRPNQQLERQFVQHDEAEHAKTAPSQEAPSQEVGAVFAGVIEGKLIGTLGLLLDRLESFDSLYALCIQELCQGERGAHLDPSLRQRLERIGRELHAVHLEVEGRCLGSIVAA